MSWEAALGRSLAFGVHPAAAWPRLGRRGRLALICGYGAAGYAIGLAILLVLNG